MQWEVDLIESSPTGQGQAKYAIVVMNNFIKWVEDEPLSMITEAKTLNFIWRSIICRFKIPHTIITDMAGILTIKIIRICATG